MQITGYFWLADSIRLFVHYIISLLSLCKFIWRHWTYKMPVRYFFVECVNKIKHILSVIHYTIYGAVCFQFTHFPCDDLENIYPLSYFHHQIGKMSYYPLVRVRSWNKGMHCMSLYIPSNINLISQRDKHMHISRYLLCLHIWSSISCKPCNAYDLALVVPSYLNL